MSVCASGVGWCNYSVITTPDSQLRVIRKPYAGRIGGVSLYRLRYGHRRAAGPALQALASQGMRAEAWREAEGVYDERRWVGEAPNMGGDAAEGDEHGDGYAGGEAGEGDDVDADDEDDDMCGEGATGEYVAGQSGAEPSPTAAAPRPGDGRDGGEASQTAACKACDEDPRAAESAASAHTPAAGDPGGGATAEQPAGRDDDEQPKRKKPRRRGGRTGWTRDHDDD